MWAYKSYNPQAPSPSSSPVMTPAAPPPDPPKFSFRSLLGDSVRRRTGHVEESEVPDTGKRPMHRNRVSFFPENRARSPSIVSGSSGRSYGTRNSRGSLAKSEDILEEILELLREMRSEKDNERSSDRNAPLHKSSSSPRGTSKPEADRMLSDKQLASAQRSHRAGSRLMDQNLTIRFERGKVVSNPLKREYTIWRYLPPIQISNVITERISIELKVKKGR
jgi:hypothetical protein